MKFAFIVNNFPPRVGGVENHVGELSKELVRQGHQAIVVTLSSEVGTENWDGVKVVRLREYARVAGILGFPGFGSRRLLTAMLRNEAVDVVSVHTRFFPMSWVGLRAAKKAHIPIVHTEHGSGHVSSESPLVRAASWCVDYTMGRSVLRQADGVLGVSEAVTAFVKKLSGREATVFYNAIPATEPLGEVELRPYHLVFVGRIVPGKGWEVFLECVAAAREREPSVTADILGDGMDLDALRVRVRELQLEEAVTVHGQVSAAEVRRTLAGATLVNPTVLSEGFQTTLLEALSVGAQVVTYPVPGANKLNQQDFPVLITGSRQPDRIVQLVIDSLSTVRTAEVPQSMTDWCWPSRSREFFDYCASLRADQQAS